MRVFISSPGDVAEERRIARRIVQGLKNDPLLKAGGVSVDVIAWDDPAQSTAMPASLTPQEAINQGLGTPAECDIVVVMLWSRLGTPLSLEHGTRDNGEPFRSGTEWEFLNAMQANEQTEKPIVLVYRRNDPPRFDSAAKDFSEQVRQYQLVQQFFADYFRDPQTGIYKGGYKDYKTPQDFRRELISDLRQEIGQLTALELGRRGVEVDTPYPGLRAYREDEDLVFFGRESETNALLLRVRDHRITFIVGPSGCGKSSLINAGLLPRLKNWGIATPILGSIDWPIGHMVPGNDPLASLAAVFATLTGKARDPVAAASPDSIASDLRGSSNVTEALDALTARILPPDKAWAQVLIIIDQLEELFTSPTVTEEHQKRFIEIIAAVQATRSLRFVLAVRADFYQKLLGFPILAPILQTGAELPLTQPGLLTLSEIIRKPADLAAIDLEEGLDQQIIADLGDSPGNLPLLAVTLQELFDRRKEGKLTFSAYRNEIKGVTGAIQQRGERAIANLSSETVRLGLPVLFRQIANMDATTRVLTRKRASTRHLEQLGTEVTDLVNALATARLLVRDTDISGNPTIEIAHERIFETWDRFGELLPSVQKMLLWQQEFRLMAASWKENRPKSGYLLGGARLVEALDMKRQYPKELSADDADFLDASVRQRNLRWAVIGSALAVPILIGCATIVWLFTQWQTRQRASSPMVPFQAANVILGGESGKPRFSIPAFEVDLYEVSNAQYQLCVDVGACSQPQARDTTKALVDLPGDLPITQVTAYQAAAFCHWLDKRLPTWQEWEYAARGTDGRRFPWGSETPAPGQVNLAIDDIKTYGVATAPVPVQSQQFKAGATPLGMMHMLGNVREWTASRISGNEPQGDDFRQTATWNGTSPATLLFKGFGSWSFDQLNSSNWGQPLTVNGGADATTSDQDLGFRCAR